jgi:hypothetical protein
LYYKKDFEKLKYKFDNYEEIDDTGLSQPIKNGFYVITEYTPNLKEGVNMFKFKTQQEAINFINAKYDALAALEGGQQTTTQPTTLSFEERLLSGARQSTITPEQQQILEAEMRQQQGSITNLAEIIPTVSNMIQEGDDIQKACNTSGQ